MPGTATATNRNSRAATPLFGLTASLRLDLLPILPDHDRPTATRSAETEASKAAAIPEGATSRPGERRGDLAPLPGRAPAAAGDLARPGSGRRPLDDRLAGALGLAGVGSYHPPVTR